MTDEREAKYGEVIWDTSRADEGTISATGANTVARAVMAVADEELAELRAEVERLRSQRDGWMATLEEMEADRDHAQAREAALRARIEALADEWAEAFPNAYVHALRAALASPAVDATPTLDFKALHDALPDEAHVCPEYNLTPEECWRSVACVECGIRRDEHAGQPVQSKFPELAITDHAFKDPASVADPSGDTEEAR